MRRALVLLLVAAGVGLVLAQEAVADGPAWLELTRYLPWPLLLAPALLALLLTIGLGPRWQAAAALASLLVAALVTGFVWHEPAAGGATFRLMTYNVKADIAETRQGGIDAIGAEVASQRPDIVVMQDARALRRSRMPGDTAPLFGLPHVYADGQYVVASRLPLRDCAPALADVAASGAGQSVVGDKLLYLACIVETAGGPVRVVTVHFESPRMGLLAARHEGLDGLDAFERNHEARLAQARALARVLAERRDLPLVVAGDLNAPMSSAVIRSLTATGFADAFAERGRGFGHTYGHVLRPAFAFLRIDHILVAAGIEVADSHVGGDAASDHRPVIADLRIRPPLPRAVAGA